MSAGKPDRKEETAVVGGSGAPVVTGKVKGLFQLLTELQILSEGEKKAGDYNPELVLPYTARFAFSIEGIHIAFYSLIFTYITLPLVIGSLHHYFPAFGKYEHSIFEKIILYSLSFSVGIVKVFFLCFVLSRLYLGRSTKIVVDWLISSMVIFILVFGVIGFFVYLVIYGYILTDANIKKFTLYLAKHFVNNTTLISGIFSFLYFLKKSILYAAFYFVSYVVVEVAVISAAYAVAVVRTKRRKSLMKKYGIEFESP